MMPIRKIIFPIIFPIMLILMMVGVQEYAWSRERNSPGQIIPQNISGYARVKDGDTIVIHRLQIRLFGIDAPETDQLCRLPDNPKWLCGIAARDYLRRMIDRQIVTCDQRDVDSYRRMVAVCYLNSPASGKPIILNQMMVANGFALAYRRYSMNYVGDENAARSQSLGVWASRFEFPWVWRHRR